MIVAVVMEPSLARTRDETEQELRDVRRCSAAGIRVAHRKLLDSTILPKTSCRGLDGCLEKTSVAARLT
jgi:hypothetical protein